MPVKIRGKYLFAPIFLSLLGFSYAVFLPEVGIEADKARVAFKKGVALQSEYKYASSVDYFLESLSYSPDFALARRMLGQSLYFSGLVDEALNEWKILLEQENYDPPLQVHLQSLRTFHSPTEPKWRFLKKIEGEMGYRYAFPTFVTKLPGDQLVLLSQGQKDSGNVLILSSNGVFTENLRRVSGKMGLPAGAVFDGNNLWITDITNDMVHRLEIEKKVLGDSSYDGNEAIGKSGSGPGEFHGPAGICYNNENIFISDQGNNRIQKFDKKGAFIQEIKSISKERTLEQPFGLACDAKYLYVSEPSSSRILQFDVFGNYIGNISDGLFKRPRHLSISGQYLVVADEASGVYLIDREKGKNIKISEYMDKDGKPSRFFRPYSAQMDSLGNLFIVDYAGHTLTQFVPEQFLYSNLEVWVERIYQKGYPEVGVWVSVKDQRGKYLTTLDSSNFTIYENDADVGRLGTGYLKEFSGQSSWVILSSKTETMNKYKDSILWLGDFFLSKLREKDQVRVWSYNSEFRPDTEWTNSRLKIQQGLKTASPETDFKSDDISGLGRALYSSVTELLSQKGKRAVIWITEGNVQPENMSDFTLSRLESYAKVNHIPVFIINFENPDVIDWKNKKNILKEFAEKTGGEYFSTYNTNLNDLEKKLRGIVEERYVLTYQSPGKKSWKGQYMEIKVNVKFQGRNGMETFGYFIE